MRFSELPDAGYGDMNGIGMPAFELVGKRCELYRRRLSRIQLDLAACGCATRRTDVRRVVENDVLLGNEFTKPSLNSGRARSQA